MKLTLTHCGHLEGQPSTAPVDNRQDTIVLQVICCAVCRTDAKMWRQGHRDLVLPRVLGHEIAAVDKETGQLYTVWPGQACDSCRYCKEGRENLCENMRIIGFHSDGGFAPYVSVPRSSLIPIKAPIDPHIVTFSEPVACVCNGIEQVNLIRGERVIIYGGGLLGMIAALTFAERGCLVTVVEQSAEKIARLRGFCEKNSIELCKDTVVADFDIAMNCCDSHSAFCLCITKLRKGGRLAFFSGLEKNEEIDTSLLNLIHYKELEVVGSYGPRREHMVQAVAFCTRQEDNLRRLIERVIRPQEVESVLPHVLSGDALKYIVDFGQPVKLSKNVEAAHMAGKDRKSFGRRESQLTPFLADLVQRIEPVSESLRNRAQKKVDRKTKPLGALGRIEHLAVQLSLIQKTLKPQVNCRRMFVFAGDHGVVEEGVSAFPAKVTVQMVENFLKGGAAINVFCRQYGIELAVVDMGVKGDFDDHPLLLKRKIAKGTDNFTVQKAMSLGNAIQAVETGAKVFLEKNRKLHCDLVGMGEMGIGNSSSAAAVICGASGAEIAAIVGRGTGVDNKGLERKIEVIERALGLHRPRPDNGLELLSAVGGYELGGICGAVLAAASTGCCVVLDGIISTAAGLLAYLICPEVKEYLIVGHQSVEKGQRVACDLLGLHPILNLDMRLGEGTGAAITMNLVDLSCAMMRDMASFEDASVDSGVLN